MSAQCNWGLIPTTYDAGLNEFSLLFSYSNPSSTVMNGGQLSKNIDYPIKAFTTEEFGSDYIRVSYKIGSGAYQNSWQGRIRNLISSK